MGFFDLILNTLNRPEKNSDDFLTVPGDEVSARITQSNRRVIKASRADGSKYSRTDYSNGTSVETITTKKK